MINDYMQQRLARKNGLSAPLPGKKEQKPIPKKSAKRKEEDKDYKKLRHEFLRSKPFCEARLRDCGKVSTDVHHSRGRNEFLLDVSTWKSLCGNCHSYLETHPAEARKLGMTASRLSVHDNVQGNKITIIDKA